MSDKNINIAHSEFDHVVAALRAYDKALDKEQKETGFVGHEARHAEIVEARMRISRVLRRMVG